MMKYHDFSVGHSGVDEAIDNYLMFGFEPGSFTKALLANDLFRAAASADHWNKENLATVASAVYMWMPSKTYGSYEIVNDWLADKDGRRTEYAKRQEKLYMLKVIKGDVKKEVPDYPF